MFQVLLFNKSILYVQVKYLKDTFSCIIIAFILYNFGTKLLIAIISSITI